MWFRKPRSHQDSKSRGSVATAPRRPSKFGPRVVEALEGRALMTSGMLMPNFQPPPHVETVFQQTNLVSDGAVPAVTIDPNLVNPWGLAASSGSPWWISDNNAGVSTLYNGNTGAKLGLTVAIPSPTGPTGGTPTGIVFNGSSTNFLVNGTGTAAHFIFATEDGTIAAWNSGTEAVLKVDNSGSGAVYKGLALATSGGNTYLYATNFNSGKVDVFDTSFAPHTFSANQFTDHHLPAGFAPFGISSIDGLLFVTYAKQNAAKHDDVAGQGLGFVDVFTTSGHLVERMASRGPLNSPWGLAVAPSSFGRFSGDILVGNFGDGRISAYKWTDNGEFRFDGQLKDASGHPIVIDGLWGLGVGNNNGSNGGLAGPSTTLFFTAGINGEADGLFGSLTATTVMKPKKSMK
jgi:uncharacterized protein (TIGR03118 family)